MTFLFCFLMFFPFLFRLSVRWYCGVGIFGLIGSQLLSPGLASPTFSRLIVIDSSRRCSLDIRYQSSDAGSGTVVPGRLRLACAVNLSQFSTVVIKKLGRKFVWRSYIFSYTVCIWVRRLARCKMAKFGSIWYHRVEKTGSNARGTVPYSDLEG